MNMQFLNVSQNVPSSASKYENSQKVFVNFFQLQRRIQPVPETPVQQPVKIEESEKKKMAWGQSIWFLFHTIAEKVKDEIFSSIRGEILNNIYAISTNLPCPMCSTHAKEYLDKINFNKIITKEDLKNMLFQFHNDVNKRKNFPLFLREELDEKYSKANTVNIIHNFILHFQDKYRSPKLIANDLQRQRITVILKEWFSRNISNFNL